MENQRQHIIDTMKTLHGGDPIEVRFIKVSGRKTIAGYFTDYAKAADEVLKIENARHGGCFVTLNQIHPGCVARAPNRMIENPEHTTSDKDIIRRKWVLVDIDPIRPAGVSSTNEELQCAANLAGAIYSVQKGFSKSLVACSGNGFHLLFYVGDCEVSQSEEMVKDFLADMQLTFAHRTGCHVDTSVHNLSRIIKLYGTKARKGFSTPDRPHRFSKLIRCDSEGEAVIKLRKYLSQMR